MFNKSGIVSAVMQKITIINVHFWTIQHYMIHFYKSKKAKMSNTRH